LKADKKAAAEGLSFKELAKFYKVFGRHYRKYWKTLLAAYGCLGVSILTGLLVPWPVKLILDNLILQKPLPESFAFLAPLWETDQQSLLAVLALSIILITVIDGTFSYIAKFYASAVGDRLLADIRERVFAHLQRLSLSFHGSFRSADIVYRMTSDVSGLKPMLIEFPQDTFDRVGQIVAYSALMMILDWRLGLMALAAVPVLFYYNMRFGEGVKKAAKTKRSKETEVTSIILENVDSLALVQAYGKESDEKERFEKQNRQSMSADIAAMRLAKMFKRVSDLIISIATAVVIYWGGKHAMAGMITPGVLFIFFSYLKQLYGPIDRYSELLFNVAKSQVAAGRLFELVETDMVMEDKKDAVAAPALSGKVEFQEVSFAYKKGQPEVLKRVNFTVSPGEKVALVGHSGAGKSTLISLLLRFYDPTSGKILMDGHDVRGFTLASLRKQMNIVLQDSKLMRRTVRDNIAFGKENAADEEVIAAAKAAQAHEFILQMPDGYDTMIWDGGDNLSGGQRQRLSIARAMLRDAPVLILDEPSSGLDAKSEALVTQALEELTKNKTTFVIAHRFATIKNADKIMLLEEGSLLQTGTHEELLQHSAQYREFYELQVLGHKPKPKKKALAAQTQSENAGEVEVLS
jgi:ATP-binding cassette subfamily B protein/subfamily B ATP-binding cassette protein MsbA